MSSVIFGDAWPSWRETNTTSIPSAITMLRLGELLGLTWRDVDFETGLVRVRKQLGRDGQPVKPKTPQAVREVVLMPALAAVLREHRLASPHSGDDDSVFASTTGGPLHYRNVSRRGLDEAAEAAGVGGEPNLRFHDLRHTFTRERASDRDDTK